jgi:glucosamine 6-phosphate synthetase-like amidotransferase/phosphosugar isomerase protein
MTTQGSEKRYCNNHPFRGQAGDDRFALAHNGMISNDHHLRKQYGLPNTAIETDSYIAVQLIERYGELSFECLADMAEKLDGSYTLTVLDERDVLYIVRGNNPMCLYHYPEYGLYLYASTEGILTQAVEKLRFSLGYCEKCPVAMGEIVKIAPDGSRESQDFSIEKIFSMSRWTEWEEWSPQKTYADELKSVAWMFGYTAEDVEALLEEGVPVEEIEDYFFELMEEGYW